MRYAAAIGVFVMVAVGLAWPTGAAESTCTVEERHAGGDAQKLYFLMRPAGAAQAPPQGYGLLLVLPGGSGGREFRPFVEAIANQAAPPDCLVAQLVAVKWSPRQITVWPTRGSRKVEGLKFHTEDFAAAVVAEIGKQHPLDPRRVFVLGWSSGGRPAYTLALEAKPLVAGAYVAMSVFKAEELPPLAQGKNQAFYLEHSPEDRVCPFPMAQAAQQQLAAVGAPVKLATYPGGHGWREDAPTRIAAGLRWLTAAAKPPPVPASTQPAQPAGEPDR